MTPSTNYCLTKFRSLLLAPNFLPLLPLLPSKPKVNLILLPTVALVVIPIPSSDSQSTAHFILVFSHRAKWSLKKPKTSYTPATSQTTILSANSKTKTIIWTWPTNNTSSSNNSMQNVSPAEKPWPFICLKPAPGCVACTWPTMPMIGTSSEKTNRNLSSAMNTIRKKRAK